MNISKLQITFQNKLLVDINFKISSTLALVGQSGSGKSLSLKALLGVLPSGMALDPQTRVVILKLLKKLQQKEEFKMLFVTHDIASAKNLCEDICVIKDGSVVESGVMQEVIRQPKEAYIKTLIEANFANRDFRK